MNGYTISSLTDPVIYMHHVLNGPLDGTVYDNEQALRLAEMLKDEGKIIWIVGTGDQMTLVSE